jgi:hypothetical protein
MTDTINARTILENSLVKRVPTWEVADAIISLGILEKGTSLHTETMTLARQASWNGHLSDDFDRVDPADTQLATYRELFPTIDVDNFNVPSTYEKNYVEVNRSLVAAALDYLGINHVEEGAVFALKNVHNLSWNKGETSSKKAFVKRVRFLANFEEKINRVEDVLELRHAQMQAKSRLAYKVDVTKVDNISLAYIAYVAARANRRSIFMIGGQSKAFDNISEGLLKLLNENSAWDQIVYVAPTRLAFKHLDAETLGRLVGEFHHEMHVAANGLARLYPTLPQRMREEMVMVRGVDSSRWNAYAGALNTMRSAWISASISAGLDSIFDNYLPGKAPRLMAADIVWWGRENGQELHEDTRLFNALPYPWEVITGSKSLNREQILSAAKKESVDATSTGWVGPRTNIELEIAVAEPATVHGVIVTDPNLALILRRVGAFSGKQLKENDTELPESILRTAITYNSKTYSVVGVNKNS